ncbi:COR domain-containing protein [Leptothoe sp. EHU-05/26/07-4]
MTPEEGYREAERRIEVARQEGATELDLSNLALTEVPESIGQLTQLDKLDLSGYGDSKNQLTGLPDAIANLTQLQSLNFSNNGLTRLLDAISNLTHLKELNLSNNQLTGLPDAIANLTQLKELNLSNNQLTGLPDAIANLTQLKKLNLSNNKLTELPDAISNLVQLQSLSCHSNQLTELPEALGALLLLEELHLWNNRITILPDCIGNLQNLRNAYLDNSFGCFPLPILRLKKLTGLALGGSGLSHLPDALGELIELRTVYLQRNKLTDLPKSLANLTHLNFLNINDNPLNEDLNAANQQGVKEVKQYLRSRFEGEVLLNEAKLILVGEGEVGKSCLLGALRGDIWVDSRPTTHGIEIKPVIVKTPGNKTEIRLNGWDFGGQRVYRPTHQLFFSSSAVYLVVWKPREGPQQGFVKEWITLIKHREPDAKILVVATHGGPGQRQPDIDRQELIDLFGEETVLGFHYVDSKTGKGITELRERIGEVATKLPGMGRLVPTKWQQIRELLEETGNTHMRYDNVIAICEEQGLEGFAAELFVRVSHTLGYLIHYHYDTVLKDIVILKPDWLAKAISFVFDDETTRNNNGLVEFDHLSHLWSHPPFEDETGYPKELHPVFLKLMERFDLSYKVVLDPAAPKTSNTYLIGQLVDDNRPEQLPEWKEQPEEGDNQQIQLCCIVDDRGQSAKAEGLFFQLIVRLHKYSLGRNNYANSIHWQRGLMLDNDYNGRALLEHIGNDVKITVRAAYPERFLAYLTEEVKWLVESFWEGLNCKIMVPCIHPCGMEQPGTGRFEVEKLIASKKKKRPEFPCPVSGCDEWQDIDQLLSNAPTAPPPSENLGIDQLRTVFRDELKVLRKDLATHDRNEQQRYQALSKNQRAMLSQIDQQFAYVMQMLTDEAKDGPRLFSFKPLDPGFFDRPKWVSEKFQLTLWCEHSRQPLPILNDGNQQGVYELELNCEWFTKAVPYFKLLTGTLSLVLPVAASTTQFMLDDATYKGIQEELDLGQKSLEFGIKSSDITVDWQTKRDSAEFEQGDAIRAQGAMLRELHGFLKEKDPSFGGLVQVQNKRREFLWVHSQFVDEY